MELVVGCAYPIESPLSVDLYGTISLECATRPGRRPVLRSAPATIQNFRRSFWLAATLGTWGERSELDPDPERSGADGGLNLIASAMRGRHSCLLRTGIQKECLNCFQGKYDP